MVDAALDHVLFELEARDAVGQEAPGAVVAVVDAVVVGLMKFSLDGLGLVVEGLHGERDLFGLVVAAGLRDPVRVLRTP